MLGSIEAAVYDTDSAGYENPRYGFVLLVMAKDSPSNSGMVPVRDSTPPYLAINVTVQLRN